MRQHGLQVRPLREFVRTTDSDHDGPIFPNLARGFPQTVPSAVGRDITYIRITAGFVYLAVILDAWSRRVISYTLGRQIDTRLALAALRAAIETRRPPRGCIHHSDRGAQYAAEPYRRELAEHGLVGSMSRRGNPHDKGKAESFMKTIKCEEVYLSEYRTHADVIATLPCFIDEVYKTSRLHSALGYLSPVRFEELHAHTQVQFPLNECPAHGVHSIEVGQHSTGVDRVSREVRRLITRMAIRSFSEVRQDPWRASHARFQRLSSHATGRHQAGRQHSHGGPLFAINRSPSLANEKEQSDTEPLSLSICSYWCTSCDLWQALPRYALGFPTVLTNHS
jgi:putative transposase